MKINSKIKYQVLFGVSCSLVPNYGGCYNSGFKEMSEEEMEKIFSEAIEFDEGKSAKDILTVLKGGVDAKPKDNSIEDGINDCIKNIKTKFEFYIGKIDGKTLAGTKFNPDDISEESWVLKITGEKDTDAASVTVVDGKRKKEEKKSS